MNKKKTIFVVVIVVFLCSIISLFLNYGKIKRNIEINKQKELERIQEEQILLEDSVPPILILSQDKLISYKGDKINYLSFVESATDNLEGDLKDKVTYQEIDINKIGDYEVVYEVQDKASNITKVSLHITIREKPNFKY